MPGTQHPQAPLRPRALVGLPSTSSTPADAVWSLHLHLTWDSDSRRGWAFGEAWRSDDGELVELPSVELTGEDMQEDVIAILEALCPAETPAPTVPWP